MFEDMLIYGSSDFADALAIEELERTILGHVLGA
jgi:hypothetical protein